MANNNNIFHFSFSFFIFCGSATFIGNKAIRWCQGKVQRKVTAFVALFLLFMATLPVQAQKVAEKTNLAGWASLSPNIGGEIALSPQWSLDAGFAYHPWKISKAVSLRHWLLSPEVRWWPCHSFKGSFWGVHLLTGQFNVHAVPLTGMPKEYEYAGFLFGGGIGYGYHFPLSTRWSLELSIGAGYIWIDYDKYECKECLEKVAEGTYNYFGLTRLGLSLIYFLQ